MALENSENAKDTIVVTGFGPFSYHKVNDSWETVKMVYDSGFEKELNVKMVIREIPVTYKDSVAIVNQLWEENKPLLVVHVGVNNTPDIKIETLARKSGYNKVDVNGEGYIDLKGPEVITTGINLQKVVNTVDSCGLPLAISENAGSFLCEYTYYLSLSRDNSRAIFVHIAPESSGIPCSTKAKILKNIISSAYQQLKGNAKENEVFQDNETEKDDIDEKSNEIPLENETTKL